MYNCVKENLLKFYIFCYNNLEDGDIVRNILPADTYKVFNRAFIENKEKDIIEKHMWPLTLRQVPKYKESFLVSFVDKYTSSCETVVPVAQKAGNYALLLITIFQGVFH